MMMQTYGHTVVSKRKTNHKEGFKSQVIRLVHARSKAFTKVGKSAAGLKLICDRLQVKLDTYGHYQLESFWARFIITNQAQIEAIIPSTQGRFKEQRAKAIKMSQDAYQSLS